MKTKTHALVAAATTLAMMVASTFVALPASAQAGDVIAEGLNGPQGVLVDDDGTVWVIDTGLGGDETLQVIDTETGELVEAAFGQSAQIVRIDAESGSQTPVAALPSVATPDGGYGGARLVRHDGTLYASVGEWATPGVDKPAGMSTIMRVGEAGATTEVADTWQHETTNDPYPRGSSHSHPYGMTTASDGRLLYADAGANAVMAVDTADGTIETFAVFEPLPGVFPRPDYDGEMLTDPVPTAVVVHDGRTYVSLLSGAPFVPGSAKVVEVRSNGELSDFATGLTMLTDLRAGPDGNLYTTTFAVFGEQGPAPASGSVTRILPDGTTEVVKEGLSFVTSIDFDIDGNAYIATNGVGPPGSGQVIRIDGMAAESGVGGGQLPATGASEATGLLVVVAMTLVAGGAIFIRSSRERAASC